MDIRDFFRPKWKHSVFRIRYAAVEKLRDQALLAKVAITDSSSEIRKLAWGKLDDQALIAEVLRVKCPYGVPSWQFCEKLHDQALLLDLARTAADHFVRADAMDRIEDQALLAGIATNADDKTRKTVVDHLKDQRLLFEFARMDASSEVRIAAVYHIEDPCRLAHIAKTDPCSDVRRSAVQRFAFQRKFDDESCKSLLAEIVETDPSQKVRLEAVRSIHDQGTLGQIARTNTDALVRRDARSRIHDRRVVNASLVDEARTAKIDHDDFAEMQIREIEDGACLADLAKSAVAACVRAAAAIKLRDPSILLDVARTDESAHARAAAAGWLDDHEALADIVAMDTDASVRHDAMRRFVGLVDNRERDEAALSRIATRHLDLLVGRLATLASYFTTEDARKKLAQYDAWCKEWSESTNDCFPIPRESQAEVELDYILTLIGRTKACEAVPLLATLVEAGHISWKPKKRAVETQERLRDHAP